MAAATLGVVSGPEPSSVPSSFLPSLLESSLALCSVHHSHGLNLIPFRCPVPTRACPCLPRPSLPHPGLKHGPDLSLGLPASQGLHRWLLAVKNPPANAGDAGDKGSIPGSGRSPGGGQWQPTPVFLSGKSHGQGSLVGYIPWGHKESNVTTKSLT